MQCKKKWHQGCQFCVTEQAQSKIANQIGKGNQNSPKLAQISDKSFAFLTLDTIIKSECVHILKQYYLQIV